MLDSKNFRDALKQAQDGIWYGAGDASVRIWRKAMIAVLPLRNSRFGLSIEALVSLK